MSHFLNSRLFGETNSVDKIYLFWKDSGLTDGLNRKLALQVSVALEIAALMLLSEEKMCDMYYKMTGEIVDDEPEFYTVIFPIIRRIISGFNEAHEHVPEILNMAKKEFNSVLWRSIAAGKESAIVYFYDIILPQSGDEWHINREHKTYHELKNYLHQKHLSRGGIISYEEFEAIDSQAEFSAYVARKIENKLIEKYERVN